MPSHGSQKLYLHMLYPCQIYLKTWSHTLAPHLVWRYLLLFPFSLLILQSLEISEPLYLCRAGRGWSRWKVSRLPSPIS